MEIQRQKPRFLTQKQAEQRYTQIQQKSVSYSLKLKFNKGLEYQGQAYTVFKLQQRKFEQNEELLLDFNGGNIQKMFINGQEITNPDYDQQFIHININQALNLSQNSNNSILVQFNQQYASDGLGMHSFTDTDGKQYVYSQCEPYAANKIFPCFDQPDLKATLTFQASAPQDWIVLFNTDPVNKFDIFNIQNEKEISNCKLILNEFEQNMSEQNYLVHYYPSTLTVPTYIYGITVGPFLKIEREEKLNGMTLRLFCRESLLPYLEKLKDYIFEITVNSMHFYEEKFEYKFAFPKYDQVFCPEYNMGAMENAGLITFNDAYLFREEVSANQMTRLATTISHELSHHWFGNLVTMRWWNDLWLNEAFATLMGYYTLTQMEIKTQVTCDKWLLFNARKQLGYNLDQLAKSTHPIAVEVENTEMAEVMFDQITYCKGSAVMRQLLSLIGEKSFFESMPRYFKKFEFANATMEDFIDNMQIDFEKNNGNLGFSLQDWKQMWLCTSGLNTCESNFDSEEVLAGKLSISQGVATEQHPTLRIHKMQIGLVKSDGSVDEKSVILKSCAQDSCIVEIDVSQNYQAVILNYQDEAYIKTIIDQKSLAFFSKKLHLVQSVLTRTLVYKSLFDMLKDGKIDAESYLNLFFGLIKNEVDIGIITDNFSNLMMVFNQQGPWVPFKFAASLANEVFDFLVSMINRQNIETKVRNLLIGQLFQYVFSDEKLEILLQWYKNGQDNTFIAGQKLSLKNSQNLVHLVSQSQKYDWEYKQQLFDEIFKLDQSDRSKAFRHTFEASKPDQKIRSDLWNVYTNNKQTEMSRKIMQSSLSGFFNYRNPQQFNEQYYQQWLNNVPNSPIDFFGQLFPVLVDEQQAIKVKQDLENLLQNKVNKDMITLIKQITIKIDKIDAYIVRFRCFQKNAPIAVQQKL